MPLLLTRSGNSNLLRFLLLLVGISLAVLALNVNALAQASDSSSSTPTKSCQNILDIPKLNHAIQSGRVYQHFDFLSKEEVNLLWEEINHLEESGAFARSGLSNTVQGSNQRFGSQDRTLCPVPWWSESLLGKEVSSPSLKVGKDIQPIASRIQDLRYALASLLNRPTMEDKSLAHECYYSVSKIGSYLPRHMDERHEELKGAKGWLLPSRRSLSWLIYLSDPEDWTLEEHGGALRSFPPASVSNASGGQLTQDQGNLQVGWLLKKSSKAQPVYLDSWFPLSTKPGQPPEPHCILYIRNQQQEQIILTQPWLTESIQGMSVPDFIKGWAERQSSNKDDKGLFLKHETAAQFALIEDRPAWDEGAIPAGSVTEDIAPTRGSLVVFDSVTLPHQVEIIKKGRRVALAGWFHEETQPFPEGIFS